MCPNPQLHCHFLFRDKPKSQETEKESGNTGRLNRNLYIMLKFGQRPKTPGITLKNHGFL